MNIKTNIHQKLIILMTLFSCSFGDDSRHIPCCSSPADNSLLSCCNHRTSGWFTCSCCNSGAQEDKNQGLDETDEDIYQLTCCGRFCNFITGAVVNAVIFGPAAFAVTGNARTTGLAAASQALIGGAISAAMAYQPEDEGQYAPASTCSLIARNMLSSVVLTTIGCGLQYLGWMNPITGVALSAGQLLTHAVLNGCLAGQGPCAWTGCLSNMLPCCSDE